MLGPAAVHVGSAQAPVNVAVPPAGAHGLPPFAMTPQEHLKYHALFISYDTNHDGFLSREELLPLFQKSGMDLPRVDLICQMVDEDKDGQLTSKEFCAAFHIIVCVTYVECYCFLIFYCIELFFHILLQQAKSCDASGCASRLASFPCECTGLAA